MKKFKGRKIQLYNDMHFTAEWFTEEHIAVSYVPMSNQEDLTSLLEMKVMKTSSLTVVVATLGPGGSNSELPNFFQFWKTQWDNPTIQRMEDCSVSRFTEWPQTERMTNLSPSHSLWSLYLLNFKGPDNLREREWQDKVLLIRLSIIKPHVFKY